MDYEPDDGQVPDIDLINRYVDGDIEALDVLCRRHGSAVYSFIYRFLGPDTHTDDVYQDVWMRVVKSLKNFRGQSRFTTWVFQVTRNICIDHLRKRRRRGPMLSLDEPLGRSGDEDGTFKDMIASDDRPVGATVSDHELIRHVREAIEHLPDEQREVFLLRESTALTFEQISELSGIPRNTVKSRMRYALSNIRRFLKQRKISEEVMTHGS